MVSKMGLSPQGPLPTMHTMERPYSYISSHGREWRGRGDYEQIFFSRSRHYHTVQNASAIFNNRDNVSAHRELINACI